MEALALSADGKQLAAARPSGDVDAYQLPGEYQLWTARVDNVLALAYTPAKSCTGWQPVLRGSHRLAACATAPPIGGLPRGAGGRLGGAWGGCNQLVEGIMRTVARMELPSTRQRMTEARLSADSLFILTSILDRSGIVNTPYDGFLGERGRRKAGLGS